MIQLALIKLSNFRVVAVDLDSEVTIKILTERNSALLSVKSM
jgi:hypothetical protein